MLKSNLKVLSVLFVGLTLFGGCAKQEFRKQQFTTSASSVGHRYLPAKVDIAVVTDNTASLNSAFSTVQGQLSQFASTLQGQYWDYHVAKISIASPQDIRQVLVNPQFNTPYLSDGTPNPNPSGLVPSDRAVNDPSQFSLIDQVYATGAGDQTYTTMYDKLSLTKNDTYTNFWRNDALLAVIVITNGYEASVDTDPYDGVINTAALQNHANRLIALKGSSPILRFYPVASYGYRANGCLTSSGSAYQGISYLNMSNYITGLNLWNGSTPTLDFCSQTALSNVMGNIASSLEIARQSYVYSAIVLDHKPIDGSIQVTKNGVALARDNVNGWSYVASEGIQSAYTVSGIYDDTTGTITALNPGLDRQTGYVIRLNGTARMIGTDVPNVIYERE